MIFCTTSYKLPFTAQQFAAAEFYDEPYFEDLIERIFPESYLDPLQHPGPGFEIFSGYAAMGERLSLAATRCYLGAFLLTAAGANFSTGMVAFSRQNDNDSLAMNAGFTYSVLDGSVTITNGSAAVVGSGTAFLTDAPANTILMFSGGSRPYRVLSVTDGTHLTLTQPVIDSSATGITYSEGWTFGAQQHGTMNITNGSAIITGTNTTFTQQLAIHDLIEFAGGTQPYRVLHIGSDTIIAVNHNVVEATDSDLAWFVGNGEQVITVNASTVVSTPENGRDYTTDLNVTFGIGQLTQNVGVTAIAASYQYNVPGPIVIGNGTTLPGSVSVLKVPVLTPGYVPTPFSVAQVTDICGGNAPTLDQLGTDRGIPRQNGESSTAYRARVRALPDTVSPGAVQRYLVQVETPLGANFDFIETWQITYQTCWDAPSNNPGTPTYQAVPPANPDFNTNLFVYDFPDPPCYPPFANRWLSAEDYRGAYIVTMPYFAAVSDVGMAYDDTATGPADLTTLLGRRAIAAYDVPANNFLGELQGGYDGFDLGKQGLYTNVITQLDVITAAGVLVEVELQGDYTT